MPALVGITAGLGTRPATHPLFKLPDGRLSRAPQRRKIDGAVRVAASAFDFEVSEAGVQSVANRRGRLRGAAVASHPIVPGVAGRDIGGEPRLPGALFSVPDPLTPLTFFRGSTHGQIKPRQGRRRQASRDCGPKPEQGQTSRRRGC